MSDSAAAMRMAMPGTVQSVVQSRTSDSAETDLRRCRRCGREGTLTSLSAGNRCEMQDDCEQARAELVARIGALRDDEANV